MSSLFAAFQTHHRARRLPSHDYRQNGWYFVTIYTKARLPLFGEVRGGVMGLDPMGCLAHACWQELPAHYPRAMLDAFIVMPNHAHGLIGIAGATGPGATGHAPSLRRTVSLGNIVGSFKSAVTRAARHDGHPFAWQPRFHDHIVRTDHALRRIRAYIENNPATWHHDRNHPPSPR